MIPVTVGQQRKCSARSLRQPHPKRHEQSDDSTALAPHWEMTLEQCLSFINDDELIECTPQNIRLRKIYLSEGERKRNSK